MGFLTEIMEMKAKPLSEMEADIGTFKLTKWNANLTRML